MQHSTQQLALPAPYGYKDGFHISLRSTDDTNLQATEDVIVKFGCPRRIAQRAISCLRSSHRYDCVVSPEWFRDDGESLRDSLEATGASVELLGKPGPDPGKAARQARQGGFRFGQFVPGSYGASSVPSKHPLHDELVSRYAYPPQFHNLPRRTDARIYRDTDFVEIERRVAALLRYAKS